MNLRIPPPSVLVAALSAVFVVVLVRTAWVCDDAFITFRTVDNFVNGYGLRWNIAERAQSFTHPLWMFTFAGAYAFTREPYFTGIALGMVFSLAAFLLYGWWIAADSWILVVGTLTLLSSKAFVDYSTSGLENPLTHLLLVVFIAAWSRRSESRRWELALWVAVGLSLTNRHDLAALLLVPALWAVWTAHDRSSLPLILIGLAPFAIWEVFSIIYYGFPMPNTAYAKLNTGIDQAALWKQGVSYYLDSMSRDPVTLLVIAAGVTIGIVRSRLSARPLAVGILVYGLYVLSIGGDNMSGRFLTAPFAFSVAMLSSCAWPRPERTVPLAASLVSVTVLISSQPLPFATGADYGVGEPLEKKVDTKTGIDDERRWYYPDTGLLRVAPRGSVPTHEWVQAGQAVRQSGSRATVSGFIGFLGFYAGRDVYIIDCHALSDPLLARLPVDRYWRTGHFARRLPAGYTATRSTGQNSISDPALHDYYDHLEDVVQGPLWSLRRFERILKLNTGAYRGFVSTFATEPSACDDIIGFYEGVLWR